MTRVAIVVVAISGFVLAVLLAGWFVWGSWVSPFEKRAMNVALDRMDELAHCESTISSCEEKKLGAETAISEAKKLSITAYDKQLVNVLNLIFDTARAECTARRNASTDQRYAKQLAVLEDVNQKSSAMLRNHLR